MAKGGDFLLGAVIGAVVGGVAAAFLTSERYAGARENLAHSYKQTRDKVQSTVSERMDDLREDMADFIEEMRFRLEDLEERVSPKHTPQASADKAASESTGQTPQE